MAPITHKEMFEKTFPIQAILQEYFKFVDNGVILDPDNWKQRLNLGAMGLAGEGGEVVDHIKKCWFHDKDIDREYIVLELGDMLWYYSLILRTLNLSLDEVISANIKKLTERYPERHIDTGVEEPVVKAPLDFEYDSGC